jgi:thiol:disulfide interchange protein DsbC
MTGLKTIVGCLVALSFAGAAYAVEKQDKPIAETPEAAAYRASIKEQLSAKGNVKGIQQLPIDKLMFVEAENGTYLISADGRFVIEGKLKDVWHRKTINSLEAARATERVPVSNIGFKPEEQLASFTIGDPKKPRTGVIFVDPTSPMTVTALQALSKQTNSNWTAVLMPLVGGNQAMDRSRRLWCSTDRVGATKDLINGTSNAIATMKQPCPEDPIAMGMMMVDVLRITSLPMVIREDGLRSEGFPVEFSKWVKQP